jgi:hypothetical protein
MSKALDDFQARAHEREQRLGKRLDDSMAARMADIKESRDSVVTALNAATKATEMLTAMLARRPCIMPEFYQEHQETRKSLLEVEQKYDALRRACDAAGLPVQTRAGDPR